MKIYRFFIVSIILILFISCAEADYAITPDYAAVDENAITSHNLNGITPDYAAVEDYCSGNGPNPSEQVFFDGFDSGYQNWDLQDGWFVMNSNGNNVLRGSGHHFAVLKDFESDNYAFKAKFKRTMGGIHFNFRLKGLSDGLHRYYVSVGDNLILTKQLGQNSFYDLIKTNLNLDTHWHRIEIRANGDQIRVFIDDNLRICYKDSNPIYFGGISFETLDNSDFLIDDVTVSK
jgi:hypothetical protein